MLRAAQTLPLSQQTPLTQLNRKETETHAEQATKN